jgi:hypothetical protein
LRDCELPIANLRFWIWDLFPVSSFNHQYSIKNNNQSVNVVRH